MWFCTHEFFYIYDSRLMGNFLITSDILFPWLLALVALRSHLPYSFFLFLYAVFRDGVLFVCMDDFLHLWIRVFDQFCKILTLYLFCPVLSIPTLWDPVRYMLHPSTQPLYLLLSCFYISLVCLYCTLQDSLGCTLQLNSCSSLPFAVCCNFFHCVLNFIY